MANVGDWLGRVPSLFIGTELNPECAWVQKGAHATKMYDGIGYVLAVSFEYPLESTDHNEKAIAEALEYHEACGGLEGLFRPWSYELCGPDIKGNHERFTRSILIPHGRRLYSNIEPTYVAISKFLAGRNTKGIVFWEELWDYTCRKAKVTQADFGFRRNVGGDFE